ncbi:Hypp2413 [Branchiostoma lanceolatum]|uniref:Hypp2413 protein n=1 Tax=Branchiostoma lanceolatum TaxID=7740 RepID=A0A8K0EMM0_BRALA|nr:Hypp2413 [Branchiostoma lanceolatum]
MAASCGWLWSIMWIILLVIIGWPLGLLCAVLYVFISPFQACCSCGGCSEFISLLNRGVNLPLTCAKNMVTQSPPC